MTHNIVGLCVKIPFGLVRTQDKVGTFDSSFCATGEGSSDASTTCFYYRAHSPFHPGEDFDLPAGLVCIIMGVVSLPLASQGSTENKFSSDSSF